MGEQPLKFRNRGEKKNGTLHGGLYHFANVNFGLLRKNASVDRLGHFGLGLENRGYQFRRGSSKSLKSVEEERRQQHFHDTHENKTKY